MKRLMALASAGLLTLAVAAPVAADPDNDGCPSAEAGWFLTPPSPGDQVVDRNGNGFICVKAVDGQGSSRDVYGFSVKDDLVKKIK